MEDRSSRLGDHGRYPALVLRGIARLKPQYGIAHLLMLIVASALVASTLATLEEGPASSFFISWAGVCVIAAIAAQRSGRRPHYWGACAGAAWPLFFVIATVIERPMIEIFGPDETEYAYTFMLILAAISASFGTVFGAIFGWTVKLSTGLLE